MKRKRELLWNVGQPDHVEKALVDWAEREVDLAIRAAVKDISFDWIFKRKKGWQISALVFDELVASISPKKLIDSEMGFVTPAILTGASADDFSEMDQFCDHLLWCARYASNKANRLKKKAGLIP